MQINGVAHFHDDVGGHGADTIGERFWNRSLIAGDHDDSHGFTDGTAEAEHDASHDAALAGWQHTAENAAFVGGAEADAAFVVAGVDGTDGRFADADDGWQNHHAKQHRRRENAQPSTAKHFADKWHEHHQAKETVDDRWNTSEKLDA